MRHLGRTLVVVNPAAQNGNGAKGAAFFRRHASVSEASPFSSLEIATTCFEGHATDIAASSSSYDTVLALGGDGVVNEVVQGLMALPRSVRPAFGVIPCGNGNDYARTLGMSTGFERAYAQLFSCETRSIDVGVCNGRYFVETLSFGLDAAIAIGTHDRRKRTGRSGTLLYVEEGFDQLAFRRDEHFCEYCFDGGPGCAESVFLFAIQIGQTYGGGFKVCPGADPCDGFFDYCIARPPLGFFKAASLFLKAKSGNHVSCCDSLTFGRARSARLAFDVPPPVQVDGERLEGSIFDISLLPLELDVLFATTKEE